MTWTRKTEKKTVASGPLQSKIPKMLRLSPALLCLALATPALGAPKKAPPPLPAAEETAKRERDALQGAAKALMGFAEEAEKAGAGKSARDAVALVQKLYPEDPDVNAVAERLAALEEAPASPELEAKRGKAFATAAAALLAWGDWLAQRDSPAVADWAYGLAAELGDAVAAGKREALKIALEAFGKHVEKATGPATREGGHLRAKAAGSGYDTVFTLPNGWSPEHPWPLVFSPHGTEMGWGGKDRDEVFELTYCEKLRRAGFVLASFRDPGMAAGQLPDEKKSNQTLEEMVNVLALRYRVHPRQVLVHGGGSGALCGWAYLECHPEQLAGLEFTMGKFHGLSKTKPGSPACAVPIRLALHLAPEGQIGVGGVKQSDFDAVHVGMMENAFKTLQRLKFTRAEWVEDKHYPSRDAEWFQARLAERAPRRKDSAKQKKPKKSS